MCDYVFDRKPEAIGGYRVFRLDGAVKSGTCSKPLDRLDREEVAYRMGSGKPTAIYASIP